MGPLNVNAGGKSMSTLMDWFNSATGLSDSEFMCMELATDGRDVAELPLDERKREFSTR